jgi:multicomponent K+:H+ antiporter subunit G
MNAAIEFLVASLILLGAVFALLGSIGLARLPDFFTRLHGPTKATTLGVGATVLASAVYFTATQPGFSLHEIAVMVFLFITAPVSAGLLAKAALHRHSSERHNAASTTGKWSK